MTDEQAKALEYPFTFQEIEWRVLRASKKDPTRAQVAAYVDSRAIQNRLDAVVGRENWQNVFESVVGSNNSTTAHICRISIYYPERGEWITKSDGAGCTDVEPIKGGLSNAFKRAASMWGMGRYLYGLKNIWANIDEYKAIAQSSFPELEKRYNQYVNQLLSKKQGSGKGNQQGSQQKQGAKQGSQQQPAKQQTPPAQQSAPQQPAPQQQTNPAPQQPMAQGHTPNPNLPNGRFNGAPARTASGQISPMQPNGCRIVNLQVTKGARSSQTLVTLENAQGKQLTGYIQGEPPLRQGQIIFNPKITTKSSPVVGNYNIIESYNVAA